MIFGETIFQFSHLFLANQHFKYLFIRARFCGRERHESSKICRQSLNKYLHGSPLKPLRGFISPLSLFSPEHLCFIPAVLNWKILSIFGSAPVGLGPDSQDTKPSKYLPRRSFGSQSSYTVMPIPG